jgi:hypothetical protein
MRKESGSSLGTYFTCPRLYFYKYVELLESPHFSQPLAFGSMVHLWQEIRHGEAKDGAVQELLTGLIKKHPQNELEIIDTMDLSRVVERCHHDYWQKWDGKLGNTNLYFKEIEGEWSYQVDGNTHVGKRDGWVYSKDYDTHFLYEMKTSGERDQETYVRGLSTDAQINSNILALKEEQKQVDGVLYDIIWKPQIRLRKGETDSDFAKRKIAEYEDNPEKYFRRELVFRNDTDLMDYWEDLSQRFSILTYSTTNNYFPRNSTSCKKFGKLCQFFDVCDGSIPDATEVFSKKDRKHMELSGE